MALSDFLRIVQIKRKKKAYSVQNKHVMTLSVFLKAKNPSKKYDTTIIIFNAFKITIIELTRAWMKKLAIPVNLKKRRN